MEYLRPKTIDEAIKLLAKGIPLAGGTQLTVKRYELDAVIDLQELDLAGLSEQEGVIIAGAMTRLQQLFSSEIDLPVALREACRHEAAWNIRNQATLGGALMGADGRSPLLTALAALDPEVKLAPGDEKLSFSELLDRRPMEVSTFIILALSFDRPVCSAYEFVARTPMDRPLVCVAAARVNRGGEAVLQIGLGGYGERPYSWSLDWDEANPDGMLAAVSSNAEKVYQAAGDAFASAEYRAEIAGILSRRVVSEVMAGC
jgi:CO/xanthine dehydrogenase FAD-binding subunit